MLLRMLERDRLPQALLFVGADAAGKTTCAQMLARRLLDHAGDLATHPDYVALGRLTDEKTGKQKTQISVEQVRELTSRLGMSSFIGGRKVAFVEEADRLSLGAANALLKTLEEPKGNTHLILCASSVDVLPATIVSRCQIFRFETVARVQIADGLVKMGFGRDDAQAAAASALGRPGLAIRFLKESAYQARLATGIAQAAAFFSASLPGRLGQAMELIPKAEEQKAQALSNILDGWEAALRDLLLRQLGLRDLLLFQDEGIDRLAESMPPSETLCSLSRVAQARAAGRHNGNTHLALEHIALATVNS